MAIPTVFKSVTTANTDIDVSGALTSNGTININVTNFGSNTTFVTISISNTSSPANNEHIDYAVPLAASETMERTGVVVLTNEHVVVRDDKGTCSVRIHGYLG
mgnify:CR=1 FL=1